MNDILFIILILFFGVIFSRIFRNINYGIALFILLSLISGLFFPGAHSAPIINLFGFSIYFLDLSTIIFFIAGLIRIFNNRKLFSSTDRLFIIYFSIELFYIIISYLTYGKTAIVEARETIYFIIPLFYFATFKYNDINFRTLYKYYYIYSIILILIAILRWFGLLPMPNYYAIEGDAYSYLRVLYADEGMNLVLFSFITTLLILQKNIKKFPHLIIVLIAVIVVFFIQQRTVWLIFALIFSIYLFKSKFKFSFVISILLIISTIYFFYVNIGLEKYTESAFQASFIQLINDPQTSTGAARIAQAITVLNVMKGGNILWGYLYGSNVNTATYFNDTWINFGIHMYHISRLLIGGLLLFIPYILFNSYILIKLLRISKITSKNNYIYLFIGMMVLACIIITFTTGPANTASIIYGIGLILIRKELH